MQKGGPFFGTPPPCFAFDLSQSLAHWLWYFPVKTAHILANDLIDPLLNRQ